MRIGNCVPRTAGIDRFGGGHRSADSVFFDARWSLQPPARMGAVLSGSRSAGEKGDDLGRTAKLVAPHPPAMISFYVAPDNPNLPEFLKRYREFAGNHGFFVAQIGFNFHGVERDRTRGCTTRNCWYWAMDCAMSAVPVLLRIGYEFNNPSALYEPSSYIGAFRRTPRNSCDKDHLKVRPTEITADGLVITRRRGNGFRRFALCPR